MKKTYKLNLIFYESKLIFTINQLIKEESKITSIVYLPKKQKKFTVLKSPHVNSKAKEQFGFNYYNILFYTTDLFVVKKILLKLPSTIKIRIAITGNGAVW